jgi:hypothetical protein
VSVEGNYLRQPTFHIIFQAKETCVQGDLESPILDDKREWQNDGFTKMVYDKFTVQILKCSILIIMSTINHLAILTGRTNVTQRILDWHDLFRCSSSLLLPPQSLVKLFSFVCNALMLRCKRTRKFDLNLELVEHPNFRGLGESFGKILV